MAGGTIDVSNLQTAVNLRVDVPVFETLNLPMLTSATGAEFRIASGGVINAPLLTDFSNSSVTLSPTTVLNAPAFTQIDNAQLHVQQGRTLAVADSRYELTNTRLHELVLGGPFLSAEDQNSLLDLSSLTEIDAGDVGGGLQVYTIRAANQGVVDLSGVVTIVGARESDWLKFQAESGGQIEFGSWEQSSGSVWLDASGVDSRIVFSGDLLATDNPQISASSHGEFHIGGNMLVFTDDPALHDTAGGILYMDGAGCQLLEVNGNDLGLPTAAIDDNFNWGELVVGQQSQATTVVLTDLAIGGSEVLNMPDALYLSGFEQGDDGLSILGGSTLILNDLNVYVGGINGDEDEWIHLNSLFAEGENLIPYDDGFLIRSLTPDLLNPDSNKDGVVNGADLADWLNSYGDTLGTGFDADFDGDTDGFDFLLWQRQYDGGTSSQVDAVPEPSCLLMAASLALCCYNARHLVH